MFIANAKSLLRSHLPAQVLYGTYNALARARSVSAKRAFDSSGRTPCYLHATELETLHRQFHSWASARSSYGYDLRTVQRRGHERASRLLRLLKNGARVGNTLELGCSDGAVSHFLQEAGKRALAMDLDASDFNPSAVAAGVRFCRMNAQTLALRDDSVELVFSFNAFEHFSEAHACLDEMIRVTKPGGYIYLYFNPLYMAPGGLHAYRRVAVPYCQHLFPHDLLDDFIRRHHGGANDLPWVNRCRLKDYRQLWRRSSHRLDTLCYQEILDASGVSLIERFPSCFRSKSDDFDEFLVAGIEALFRKRASPS